ncbi:hypothetical protein [Bradyrhizobium sp. SYSU BS000235]|uniref:hypothetical protein n=1 Tax=Bradyrhizobium sp. SYSU BS000235 TaxID=3411332 RepID=UPI003C7676DB
MPDFPDPPFIYEGADNIPGEQPRALPGDKSGVASVSESVSRAIHALQNAIHTARQPGMPLSILSNVAREAPLGSLLVAFVLGIAVGRRR